MSASVTFMFRELELAGRFAAARAAGFEGVEIQYLAEGPLDEMARAARDAGVQIVVVNADAGDFAGGGLGLSGVPGREAQFCEAIAAALDAATLLGASFVNVGPSRVPDGVERGDCLATLCANLASAHAAAAERDIALLLEPLNDVDTPMVLLGEIDTAAELVAGRCRGQIGLLFDAYHVAMTGRDVSRAFVTHREHVRHVQFSDAPGRNEPGTGTIAFAPFLETLVASSYGGWLGAEYRASMPTVDSLRWLPTFRAATTNRRTL